MINVTIKGPYTLDTENDRLYLDSLESPNPADSKPQLFFITDVESGLKKLVSLPASTAWTLYNEILANDLDSKTKEAIRFDKTKEVRK